MCCVISTYTLKRKKKERKIKKPDHATSAMTAASSPWLRTRDRNRQCPAVFTNAANLSSHTAAVHGTHDLLSCVPHAQLTRNPCPALGLPLHVAHREGGHAGQHHLQPSSDSSPAGVPKSHKGTYPRSHIRTEVQIVRKLFPSQRPNLRPQGHPRLALASKKWQRVQTPLCPDRQNNRADHPKAGRGLLGVCVPWTQPAAPEPCRPED